MKKGILALLVMSSIVFFGCGYTKEEQELMDKYEEIGESNAIKYVENKYGFTPKVIETKNTYNEPGIVPDFSPMPNGTVLVTMEYGDKEFEVEITGEEESLDGADNYQKEEILAYLNDYVVEHYPMVEEAEFYELEQDDYYFSELLTGDNFKDYVEDYYVAIKLCDKDVSEFPVAEFGAESNCSEISVLNYRDKDKMPLLFNSGIWTSSGGPDMDSILPYISQYEWYDPSDGESIVKDVYTKYDEDIVVCTLVDEPVYVTKAEKSVDDEDLLSYQSFIDAYKIQSNAKDVWIYVPHSMVNKDQSIAFYYGKYEETSYETEGYDYIDNMVISNDESDEFATSFEINICTDKKRQNVEY